MNDNSIINETLISRDNLELYKNETDKKIRNHVENKISENIDETLTKSGFSADSSVVGKKIDEINGSISTLSNEIEQNKTDISNVKTDIQNLQNQDNVLSSRIDNLSTLPDGSTTADAELADVRVGADGTIYENAGTAVRTQIGELKNDLADKTDAIGNIVKLTNYQSGYINKSDGAIYHDSESKCIYKMPIVYKLPMTIKNIFVRGSRCVCTYITPTQLNRVIITNSSDTEVSFTPEENDNYISITTPVGKNSTIIYNLDILDYMMTQTSCYVDSTQGNDSNSGRINSPFRTINKAIDIGYKTIYIKPGEYNETISLDNAYGYKFLPYNIGTFKQKSDTPLIHLNGGENKNIKSGIILNNCYDILFENIWCDNTSSYGTNIVDSFNICMNYCHFSNTFRDGLRLLNVNGVFNNCKAFNVGDESLTNADGFNIHGFGNTIFNDCIAYDCLDDGISHHDGCTGYINGGEFYNNGKGGVSSPCYGAKIDIVNVYCHDNRFGVYLDASTGDRLTESNISNSIFKNNSVDLYNAHGKMNIWNVKYTTSYISQDAIFNNLDL